MWVKALAGLVFAAVAAPALAAPVTLVGDVTYRERIALPEGATLRVRLVDMTAPGNPARVEAQAPIGGPGQVPLTFTLNFDDAAIDAAHGYAIVAEISVGPELWFRNSTPYAVAPLAPEAPIVVVTNFVGRLVGPAPTATPGVPAATPSILDVTWRAEAIRGDPADARVESTLSIAGDMRAGGKGGCNSYFAQVGIDGEALRFSAVAATMMACASVVAGEQERAFFEAIGATRYWRMDGDRLVLLDADGGEVLRFARAAR